MTLEKRPDTNTIEQVVLGGDLGTLTPDQRMSYYSHVCASLGLNPLTKPFQYIRLNNKLTLYATRDCTDQMRNLHSISTQIVSREIVNDIYVVTAKATKGDRIDESIGAVSIMGLKGDALANAMMKTETKAKRRVTLSINGLGVLDESEISSIPDGKVVDVDPETGEILGQPSSRPAIQPPTPDGYGPEVWAMTVKEMGQQLSAKRDELGIPPEILKEQAASIGLDNPAKIKPDQFMTLMDWLQETYGAVELVTSEVSETPTEQESLL